MEYISREDYCEYNCGKENREGYKTCKNCSMLSIKSADVSKMTLYHVTTEKKAKHYRDTGFICKPVRGFDTLMGAMAWAIKTGRKVIYKVEGAPAYKLPDHHNRFGEAYWIDQDILVDNIECVRW